MQTSLRYRRYSLKSEQHEVIFWFFEQALIDCARALIVDRSSMSWQMLFFVDDFTATQHCIGRPEYRRL